MRMRVCLMVLLLIPRAVIFVLGAPQLHRSIWKPSTGELLWVHGAAKTLSQVSSQFRTGMGAQSSDLGAFVCHRSRWWHGNGIDGFESVRWPGSGPPKNSIWVDISRAPRSGGRPECRWSELTFRRPPYAGMDTLCHCACFLRQATHDCSSFRGHRILRGLSSRHIWGTLASPGSAEASSHGATAWQGCLTAAALGGDRRWPWASGASPTQCRIGIAARLVRQLILIRMRPRQLEMPALHEWSCMRCGCWAQRSKLAAPCTGPVQFIACWPKPWRGPGEWECSRCDRHLAHMGAAVFSGALYPMGVAPVGWVLTLRRAGIGRGDLQTTAVLPPQPRPLRAVVRDGGGARAQSMRPRETVAPGGRRLAEPGGGICPRLGRNLGVR